MCLCTAKSIWMHSNIKYSYAKVLQKVCKQMEFKIYFDAKGFFFSKYLHNIFLVCILMNFLKTPHLYGIAIFAPKYLLIQFAIKIFKCPCTNTTFKEYSSEDCLWKKWLFLDVEALCTLQKAPCAWRFLCLTAHTDWMRTSLLFVPAKNRPQPLAITPVTFA